MASVEAQPFKADGRLWTRVLRAVLTQNSPSAKPAMGHGTVQLRHMLRMLCMLCCKGNCWIIADD